jgi:hypothetical protein
MNLEKELDLSTEVIAITEVYLNHLYTEYMVVNLTMSVIIVLVFLRRMFLEPKYLRMPFFSAQIVDTITKQCSNNPIICFQLVVYY